MRLAIRLQGSLGGLTLDDIRIDFSVSRRTAERLRDAVEAVFGPLEIVDTDDNKRHWRLRSDALRRLVPVSAGELTELASAATSLERLGLEERAALVRDLATKLRATLRPASLARVESDLEALVHAEGLAMRPGPRPRLDTGLLSLLREAITTCRVVEFRYFAQSTRRRSRQRVQPYGLLYGNRAFLVARTDWSDEPRLWRLADETFERDPACDVSSFVFHPDQSVEENGDGSLTIRFRAGGIDEMCWLLFTWVESVTVEKPVRLRRRLAGMCEELESTMDSNCREISQNFKSLMQEGIIDNPETDPAQSFRDRIVSLS